MRSTRAVVRASKRRQKACEAYASGATLGEAAKAAGYYDASAARQAIMAACAATDKRSSDQVVAHLQRQADELCLLLWKRLEDPEATHKDVEALGRTLLGAWARLATLLGVDAAKRVDCTVRADLPSDPAEIRARVMALIGDGSAVEGKNAAEPGDDPEDARG